MRFFKFPLEPLEQGLCDDAEVLQKFVWVLRRANHDGTMIDKQGHKITVQRGEWLTSERELEHEWKWSRNRVRRFLHSMQRADLIRATKEGKGTRLSVRHWWHLDTLTIPAPEPPTIPPTAPAAIPAPAPPTAPQILDLRSQISDLRSQKGSKASARTTPKTRVEVIDFDLLKYPLHLDKQEIKQAVKEYAEHRRSIPKAAWSSMSSVQKFIDMWAPYTAESVIKAIDKSIANGHRGCDPAWDQYKNFIIVEKNGTTENGKNDTSETWSEKVLREMRELREEEIKR